MKIDIFKSFELAQQVAKMGSWELNLINNELYWSDELYHIFELDKETFSPTYEKFINIVHPDDRDLVNEEYTKSLETKSPYQIIHRIQLHDGRIKYVNEICKTFYDNNGIAIKSIGTAQDITECVVLKELLNKTEEKYTNLFENINIGIFNCDLEGNVTNYNNKFLELLDYNYNLIDNLNIFDLVHPIQKPTLKHSFKTKNLNNFELNINISKSYNKWLLLNGKFIKDYYEGFVFDITNKKIFEKEQYKLSEIIKNTSNLIIIINIEGELEYINNSAKKLLEISNSKNHLISDIMNEKNLLIYKSEILPTIFNKMSWEGKITLNSFINNNKIILDFNVNVIKDNFQNLPISIVFNGKDITNQIESQNLLKESQESFIKTIIEIPFPMLIFDHLEGEILVINNKCNELFLDNGIQNTKFIKNYCHNILNQTNILDKIENVDKIYDYELKLKKNNNEEFYCLISSQIIIFNKKKYLLSTFHDISKIKNTERLLKESEAKFRGFLNFTPDAMVVVNSIGEIILSNQQVENIFGYSKNELTGENVNILIPSKVKEIHNNHVSKFFKSPKLRLMGGGLELSGLHKNGTEFPVEVSLNHFNLDKENVVICSIRDVTERQSIDFKIREQATLLNQAKDAIITINKLGEIKFWNKGAELIYGWSDIEINKTHIKKLFLSDVHYIQYDHAFEATIKYGHWKGEINHKSKLNKEIIFDSNWSLIKKNENDFSILIINTNITEKKYIEKQLLKHQRIESLGTLAGGVAHDLNNILTPIMMSIEILKSKYNDEQGLNIIEMISISALRASNLVKQVLSFARGVESERAIINMKNLVLETHKIIKEIFPKTIILNLEIQQNLWMVNADYTQIQQVFLNLCVNARDAMPKGGGLNIELENIFIDEKFALTQNNTKAGPYVVITVSDTGSGIENEAIERIFDPFFTTKEFGKGTGLGLATAHTIIRNHNGFIDVFSEINNGTTFKVYIPAEENEQEFIDEQLEMLPNGNGQTILIIDDEKSILEMTKSTLEMFGYNTKTAIDGIDGIVYYSSNFKSIDLIITDMVMPFLDGEATIRSILRINPNAKIIAMSGIINYKSIENKENIFFIQKPFSTKKLLNTINTILNNS